MKSTSLYHYGDYYSHPAVEIIIPNSEMEINMPINSLSFISGLRYFVTRYFNVRALTRALQIKIQLSRAVKNLNPLVAEVEGEYVSHKTKTSKIFLSR